MNIRLLQLLLLLYLPYAIFVIVGGVFTYRGEVERESARIEMRESHELELASKGMQAALEGIFDDIVFLASAPAMRAAVRHSVPGELCHLEDHLAAFVAAKPGYEKVRWIDQRGMERVRVERSGDAAMVLPAAALQDKSYRYYVPRTLAMGAGDIFVSALDLQEEHGRVVEPFRPLMRVATPLVVDGRVAGMAIINFEGGQLITSFLQGMGSSSLEHAYLLDIEGNLMRSPRTEEEWSAQTGRARTFVERHALAWERIAADAAGQFHADDGLWTFRHYSPWPANLADAAARGARGRVEVERPFVLVSHVARDEIKDAFRNAQVKIGGSVVLLLLVGLAGSYMLAVLWVVREKGQAEMERLGERDVLLGSLGEGVLGVDAAGQCVFANAAAAALLGLPPERLHAQPVATLIDLREDASTDAPMPLALSDLAGRVEYSGWLRSHAGSHTPVLLAVAPVRHPASAVAVVVSLQDITELKKVEADAYNLAFFDPLTGLPNRRMLLEHLTQALAIAARTRMHGALVFIDIDRFRLINEAYGQQTGDRVLIEFGYLLNRLWRSEDTVAHLGSDHYAVLMESLGAQDEEAMIEAESAGARLLAGLGSGLRAGDVSVALSASIGITLLDADTDPETLLMRGEMAMEQAKRTGANGLRFFDPAMQARVDAMVFLEAEIRDGLGRNEFVPFYQPKVDCTGRMLSAEALCRWHHPRRGLVAPGEFIPVAESSGLILLLGFQMLEQVCRQLALWSRDPRTAGVSVAVNVGARQFTNPEMVGEIASLLEATGAPPERLIIELTETQLAEHLDDVVAKMNALLALGVRFALDDFGTGYSSLSYLQRLPVGEIKIDRAFVADVDTNANDLALVRAIVAMGHSLGAKIVAEGVETAAQCDLLRAEGCDMAQGYYFARPMPVEELEKGWF